MCCRLSSLRDPTSPCPFASEDVFAREFFEVTHRGAFLRVYNQTKLHRANPCKQVTNALDCEAKYVAALTRRRPEDVMLPLKWLGGQHRKLLLQKGLVQWNNKEDAAIQRSMEDATMKWKKSKKNKKARTETRERGGAQSNET